MSARCILAEPILYSFRRCPYAMRARLALLVSETRCEIREVKLRDKPAEMLAASPKGTVPVLVLADGAVIDQSLDIMRWALGRNDPERWLDGDDAELIAVNDGAFKHHLDRYKYPERFFDELHPGEGRGPGGEVVITERNTDYRGSPTGPRPSPGCVVEDHRASGLAILGNLDKRLTTRAYLHGATRTLTDAAIFPFVRQFAAVDRAWFDAQPLAALQRWLAAQIASPLFAEAMVQRPQWKTGSGEA